MNETNAQASEKVDTRGYHHGHPWYYLLGGAIPKVTAIRDDAMKSEYQGYMADDIDAIASQPEPQRSQKLDAIRADVVAKLRNDISIYREVARELRAYRRKHEGEPIPARAAEVHTSVGLKLSHMTNGFAHLKYLDSLPRQACLFDGL